MTTPVATTTAALAVQDLEVAYTVRGIDRAVLRGVSFSIAPGEAYGLVGESGCGKSTTAYAAVRYLPRNGKIVSGRVLVAGEDVTGMSTRELQHFRATEASMVYQDPAQAMNPSVKIGRQLVECFTLLGQSKTDAAACSFDSPSRVKLSMSWRPMRTDGFIAWAGSWYTMDASVARNRCSSDARMPVTSSPATSTRPLTILPLLGR